MSSLGPEAPPGRDPPQRAVGGLHRLDVNYRSRPEMLDFINRLFAHESFFGARFAALSAGSRRRVAGRQVPRPPLRRSRCWSRSGCRRDEPDAPPSVMQQAEAEALAARIRGLIDDEGWRAARHRGASPGADARRSLSAGPRWRGGWTCTSCAARATTPRRKSSDVASLLRLLVNPHDDLALVSVLRSPLVGVSDDGLYLLGREGRRTRARSLWEVVRDGRTDALESEDGARARRSSSSGSRSLRRRGGTAWSGRLIDDAISVCGYDVCLLASPEGKRRFANVRKLMRMADEFEALEGPDLAGFVDLLQSMGDLSDREGSAPTLAEGEDVVRVMTSPSGQGAGVPRGGPGRPGVGRALRVPVGVRGRQRWAHGRLPQGFSAQDLRIARPLLGSGRGDRRRRTGQGVRRRMSACSMWP